MKLTVEFQDEEGLVIVRSGAEVYRCTEASFTYDGPKRMMHASIPLGDEDAPEAQPKQCYYLDGKTPKP